MHPTRVYAHRGAAIELPENTMESFERALSYEVDALEMDVHLSADGKIVVSHDGNGKRMCNMRRNIRDCSYEEIRGWDAGWGYESASKERPFAGKGMYMPLFEEVLDAFPAPIINVDLKPEDPRLARAMMELVHRRGEEKRVILASFFHRNLLRLRRWGYRGMTCLPKAEVAASLFVPNWLLRPLPYRGDAAQIPTGEGRLRIATRSNIEKLHQLGLRVDFWTINDPDEAVELLRLGADGIMTDDPKLIAPAVRAHLGR